jgi:hypothetical protein
MERKLMRSAKVWAYRGLSGKKYFEVLLDDRTSARIDFLEGSTTQQSFLALVGALELNLGGCRITPMNKLALFDQSEGLSEEIKRELSQALYNPLNNTEAWKQFARRLAETNQIETPELSRAAFSLVDSAAVTKAHPATQFPGVQRSEDNLCVRGANWVRRTNARITPFVKVTLHEVAHLMADIGGPRASPLKVAAVSGVSTVLDRVSNIGAACSEAVQKTAIPRAWAMAFRAARGDRGPLPT